MGVQQPYLYSAQRNESRFPETVFDPKAVTRASWEPKPRRPKQEGPLVNFNQHPEYVIATSAPSRRVLGTGYWLLTQDTALTWFSHTEQATTHHLVLALRVGSNGCE